MYRKTYFEIDTDVLKENINKIKKMYCDYTYYIGVVKNNAYGHGIECIKYMKEAGINYFAVSSLEEALKIRDIDKNVPVLVMEPINLSFCEMASKNNITITIDNLDYYKKLVSKKIKLNYHLKLNTGMNRFGTSNKKDVNYMFNDKNDYLNMEGIFTHLTIGFESSKDYNDEVNCFLDLTSDIDLSKIKIVHLDRSLTMQQHKKLYFANGVRMGIVMYGFSAPKNEYTRFDRLLSKLNIKSLDKSYKMDLEQVSSFKSEVIETRNIKKGDKVGYGGEYLAEEDEKIAIVAFGFGDYLFNNLSYVYIKNKRYKVIAINMDITIVKVDENVKNGDEVEVFGNNITLRDRTVLDNQNVYKILSSISSRVPRIYKEKNKKIEINY